MWKPPERIRYRTHPGEWPTAAVAAASKLFMPLNYQALSLSARTWVPAMVPWRATETGFVTPDNLDWYERFARGQPGVLVVEATGIRDIASGPLMRISDDRFIPGLQTLVERVRAASDGQTRLLIQLIDFLTVRRRPEPEKFFARYLKITDQHRDALKADDWSENRVRKALSDLELEELKTILSPREFESLRFGYREHVTDTQIPHIAELPETLPVLFADAARRAQIAGFDGVELHYAHAYTMASFLSATNNRRDGYGDSLENRVRLPIEVYQAVRETVGKDFVVGCRFLTEDCIENGSSTDDSSFFAQQFAAAGMDFVSTSRGGKFDDAKQPTIGDAAYPYTGPSGYECIPGYLSDAFGPFGRNFAATAKIRTAIRNKGFNTPVVVTGGIHDFQQAQSLLESGTADVIGLARQSLADPDWFFKLRSGRGDEIRVCEYTNYCEGLDRKHKQVTCQLWDRTDLDEPGISRSRDNRRRLVAPHWRSD
ncbi:MAG TPA: NADH:flavin oxidoreductase [Gammaproteobacteria bacterium]|jgi:2,4-dienoyl-CoA reductase-like NADH-dependent reductase (Old Yellow Enzyme family)|nr:NADH:flavin oxidoreductase [Gammaproteobacteria bacterium]PHS06718.1 MAG: NADH oxidase [Acidithiobacillus sp.]RTZ62570.1 MAG: NADH:flavin oxidoreductase [Gammaproteobacteria bacterium]HAD37955.1 NADH oxidase [Gammaproteobacteria bacterium]HBK75792.1 NADH oxidase [Gammaproteobacteria bacterium]